METMPPVNYKLYQYKGTLEQDAVQAERMKKIEQLEKVLEKMKRESRTYVYNTENGRV
jgi:hypothetical protein